jgi:hypothetical protein
MLRRYEVLAIIACGTIIRGTPDPRSDLDLYVLHRNEFRQRLQLFFAGVPCEIFVNPPSRLPEYFAKERNARRPLTAHMLATGVVVFDPEAITESLVEEARVYLADPPELDKEALVRDRYFAASIFEDAEDLRARDVDAALLLLGQAVYDLVRCSLIAEAGWIPRHKDILSRLREIDPESARLAREASIGAADARFTAARELCLRVTGASGFFEWSSAPEWT